MVADEHPGRFLVAAMVSDPGKPTRNVTHLRELARHPRLAMVRVAPLFTQVPIDDARHYPVYQVCEELGLPVAINVGVPGPRVRSNVQHPERLEGVMIDFPSLTIIGAHMGHPYEELLMNYMRKWDRLYLSCTAYAPRYMDPGPGGVHEHVDLPGPRAVGQRRPVVPDAALARGGEGPAARRRRDGALPRRHRPPAAHPLRGLGAGGRPSSARAWLIQVSSSGGRGTGSMPYSRAALPPRIFCFTSVVSAG